LIPALCALHNYILAHDPNDNAIGHWEDDDDIPDVVDTVVQGSITEEERTRAGQRRDELAQQMWDDYLEYI
ncbi:hypothetical protein FA13DRAFT_1602848, partial [Coprinellus micaceus]